MDYIPACVHPPRHWYPPNLVPQPCAYELRFESRHPTQFVLLNLAAIVASAILYRDFEACRLSHIPHFCLWVRGDLPRRAHPYPDERSGIRREGGDDSAYTYLGVDLSSQYSQASRIVALLSRVLTPFKYRDSPFDLGLLIPLR